jgi:hypothetical protein
MLKGDATAEPGRYIPFEKKLEDAATYSIGGGGASAMRALAQGGAYEACMPS